MLAAYAETMATKQAVERPVLRHPAGEPAGALDVLRKEKNKAEQLHRQVSATLQKKNLQVLAIQERIAQDQKELLQTQKEQADLVALKEEKSKDLALKDQQLQAAMAQRERELLLQTGAPAAAAFPESFSGPGQFDGQTLELVEKIASVVAEVRQNGNCNLQPLLDALALLGPALAAQHKPARSEAPPTPLVEADLLPTPQAELNEVSMAEGKRKPEDDAGELEGKKTKTSDKDSPSVAKTIADAEAINRLVNRNLRGPDGSASSSAGQQQG